jgi:hypothetical protein
MRAAGLLEKIEARSGGWAVEGEANGVGWKKLMG